MYLLLINFVLYADAGLVMFPILRQQDELVDPVAPSDHSSSDPKRLGMFLNSSEFLDSVDLSRFLAFARASMYTHFHLSEVYDL